MRTLLRSMQHVFLKHRARILARFTQPLAAVATASPAEASETAENAIADDAAHPCFKYKDNRELLEQFQIATGGLVKDFLAEGDSYYLSALLDFLKLLDASMNAEPYLTNSSGNGRTSDVTQFVVLTAERISSGKYRTPHDLRKLLDEACQNFDDDILLAAKVAKHHPYLFQAALSKAA